VSGTAGHWHVAREFSRRQVTNPRPRCNLRSNESENYGIAGLESFQTSTLGTLSILFAAFAAPLSTIELERKLADCVFEPLRDLDAGACDF